jgi:type IV pilus assembly protein PilB
MAAATQDLGYKSLPLNNQTAYTLTKGTDTPETPGGYRGRMGLYEVFEVSEPIQNLIMKRATSTDISKLAQEEGMITMRQDGYLKALDGQTSLAEVNRVAAEDNA